MNTAEMIVEVLGRTGVKYMFGIPGGAIEDLNTALYKNSYGIIPIVTKHEEGAAFMADGYARLSGKLGVCYSTSGPGATNLITGLAFSYVDQIPILALTGQVATSLFGKGALQESGPEQIDLMKIFSSITKYSRMLMSENRSQYMLQKAIRLALSNPGGPVHLNMPADIMKRSVPFQELSLFPTKGKTRLFDAEHVDKIAETLVNAQHPAIIAGWGVYLSQAMPELLDLAELLQIPVATSPKGKGVFPESHELSLGVLGFAGSPVAEEYIITDDIDVIFAVGTSFSEMMTNGWDEHIRPSRDLIHLDVDAEKIGKNYPTSLPMEGDAKINLKKIFKAVQRIIESGGLAKKKRNKPVLPKKKPVKKEKMASSGNLYHPAQLIIDIQEKFPKDTIFFADAGTAMAWTVHYMTIDQPASFFASLGYASMGYAVAAPVGAGLAAPDHPVVAIVGDGSFLMNGFEVATAVNYKVPVTWVILNNAMLGMVYHGRRLYKKAVPDAMEPCFQRVDYVKIAEGLGARGIHLDANTPLSDSLVEDILTAQVPTVLDVWIDDQAVPPIHGRIKSMDTHFA
ncbi:acetolactate synthase-1/2/3 large subunit [Candidatus Electrothrix aarhusensis]|jgi:acetolactate synthase-1/2/3 large subunit|uniref:Acetolactate synthase-1/2/3 large subunit n=1 Tax=Candidatus Electrothrix aarhusensis TaxID=1859131 RepID=A0A444J031_9BACT|nr:acetolactate synthase-1/2/3 large subunit [Candidatus Electrothrix aarhusensis]